MTRHAFPYHPGVATRLMVSVRDSREAAVAVAGGADLIDVKEPDRGPLGAADAHVIGEILRWADGRVPVSAAMGELRDWSAEPCENEIALAGLEFAKFSLARCRDWNNWPVRWCEALCRQPAGSRRVAVVYADWESAGAPAPSEVLGYARRYGCDGVLVDTFDKSHGNLCQLWSHAALAGFIRQVRVAELFIALAGSLSAAEIPWALGLQPDVIAVRGAACAGGRRGRIERQRVESLARLLAP